MVGWIKVEGTKINYPVMQTSIDNKDYYIDHDFNHRARGCGAIYVRETCDVFDPSDNVTMYGHHMKDMSMFAGLDYYRDKSFWETHQTFTFDTLYEHHTYQVIATFKTSANVGQGFSYHRFENAANEAEFNEFIKTVKELAMYDTGISAEYGDKLVCLSTCEYTLNNGRLVVVAKRIS
jgi:sortase B